MSSETALHQQLVEFEDHRLTTTKRLPDGQETIVMSVEPRIALDFLKQKGLIKKGADDSTEDDDDDGEESADGN